MTGLDHLKERGLPPNFSYSIRSSKVKLKEIILYFPDTNFLLDTCVLSRSIDVLKTLNTSILNGAFLPEPKVNLLKSLYGQVKAVNYLAENDRLLSIPNIKDEFFRGVKILRREYAKLQKLQNTTTFGFDCEDFVKYEEHVYEQMNILEDNVSGLKETIEKTDLDEIVKMFKSTPFYIEKYKLGSVQKEVSSQDLELLLSASYLNSMDENLRGKVSLVTNDWDLLSQGPIYIDSELYDMPQIHFGTLKNNSFTRNFLEFSPPDITAYDCQDYLEKH